MSLNYTEFIAPTIRAMEEMKVANDSGSAKLKANNDNLRKELEKTRADLQALKAGQVGRRAAP